MSSVNWHKDIQKLYAQYFNVYMKITLTFNQPPHVKWSLVFIELILSVNQP